MNAYQSYIAHQLIKKPAGEFNTGCVTATYWRHFDNLSFD